jgi:2',3'-cyclic-nucleotide 2'-phosphodiesterase (5'-nucleotidase family)
MKFKYIFICVTALILNSCKHESYLYKIEGKQINISDSLETNAEIDAFIKPYREHVSNDLDSVLAYSVGTYSKTDGELNTAIGNLFADAVLEEANPIFKSRTGHDIDIVLLNHGGIRSIISKGDVTLRTAYELMPFENSAVVVKLKGKQIQEMIDYLIRAKTAHPISGMKILLDKDFKLKSATINGKPFDVNKTYFVATNDYLYMGGNNMDFFKTNDSLYILDYKIRNILIDYFSKKDTLNPVIDDRFIQMKN